MTLSILKISSDEKSGTVKIARRIRNATLSRDNVAFQPGSKNNSYLNVLRDTRYQVLSPVVQKSRNSELFTDLCTIRRQTYLRYSCNRAYAHKRHALVVHNEPS